MIGVVLILIAVFMALAAPIIAPYDPAETDMTMITAPPFWAGGDTSHLLGTDSLGRDILSRIIYGARISLLVGLLAVLIQGTVGVTLGLIAGFFRGKAEAVIMRIADVQLGLPTLVLAIAVMAVLGSSLRNVIIVLGLTGWVVYGRVVRGDVLSVREKEYLEAARAIGASNARQIFRHVLPNVRASIIVVATLQIPRMIISEASLSFLGLGVPPSVPTWGSMVTDGRDYIATAAYISMLPGVAIVATVLGINLFGDWLREILDPRQRGVD
jgi:peptide/nickel transport system permease protein